MFSPVIHLRNSLLAYKLYPAACYPGRDKGSGKVLKLCCPKSSATDKKRRAGEETCRPGCATRFCLFLSGGDLNAKARPHLKQLLASLELRFA